MPHGGFRPGAGRPRGARNLSTLARERGGTPAELSSNPGEVLSPGEYLLRRMNDPAASPAERLRCAAALLPFYHARISEHRRGKKEIAEEEALAVSEDSFWATHLPPPPRRN